MKDTALQNESRETDAHAAFTCQTFDDTLLADGSRGSVTATNQNRIDRDRNPALPRLRDTRKADRGYSRYVLKVFQGQGAVLVVVRSPSAGGGGQQDRRQDGAAHCDRRVAAEGRKANETTRRRTSRD